MTMTIKCLQQCGDVCQRRIGAFLLFIMGVASVAAMVFVLISW
jgi:hypothetical protein